MIRSPASASLTIFRYRGSKTCRGSKTFGKRTALGSGKIGMEGGSTTQIPKPESQSPKNIQSPKPKSNPKGNPKNDPLGFGIWNLFGFWALVIGFLIRIT